ncbi:MAG: HD domain-containing protein [Candidatus Woesearchaeota archaeon]
MTQDVSVFYQCDENLIQEALRNCFSSEVWLPTFFDSSHHGFMHANQVREACIKLIGDLTESERENFLKEGEVINQDNPLESAIAVTQIAAIFHDSGRFNSDGAVLPENQNNHHTVGAERGKYFCEKLGFNSSIGYVEDAVLSHDYQSDHLTPDFSPPKTIIGKIVQSADQMGWFHPQSLKRTMEYNREIGIPFYNASTLLQDRLSWTPNKTSRDSLTVMLSQLFGPRGPTRFGIESARRKINSYLLPLKENILKIAEEHQVFDEVKNIISQYEKIRPLPV